MRAGLQLRDPATRARCRRARRPGGSAPLTVGALAPLAARQQGTGEPVSLRRLNAPRTTQMHSRPSPLVRCRRGGRWHSCACPPARTHGWEAAFRPCSALRSFRRTCQSRRALSGGLSERRCHERPSRGPSPRSEWHRTPSIARQTFHLLFCAAGNRPFGGPETGLRSGKSRVTPGKNACGRLGPRLLSSKECANTTDALANSIAACGCFGGCACTPPTRHWLAFGGRRRSRNTLSES
jgi:hypothetical protein